MSTDPSQFGYGFAEPSQPFKSVDFGATFSSEPGGEIFRPSSFPEVNRPKSVYETAQEYINKVQQFNDAVRFQHRVDNIYEQMFNTAPPRDVEVLPPENPVDAFNRGPMKSARPPDEMPPDLSDVYNRPATPNTSGANRNVNQTIDVTPMPAEPRTPWSNSGSMELDRPRNIPSNFARGAGAGALVDFGMRLGMGQPPGEAAAGAVGGAVGGVVGATAGSAFGPVGTFVGGYVGSVIGSAVGDYVYNKLFPPAANTPTDSSYTGPLPFYGGQTRGVQYGVEFDTFALLGQSRDGTYIYGWYGKNRFGVVGPILGLKRTINSQSNSVSWVLQAHDDYGNYKEYSMGGTQGGPPENIQAFRPVIQKIWRLDGQPDTGGNTSSPPQPIPTNTRSPESQRHPINNSAPPRAQPQTSNNPAPNDYAPGTTDNKTGGSPKGDSPTWVRPASPHSPTGHPDVHPGKNTNPIPETAPKPQTNTNPNPNTQTFPSNNPNTGGRFFRDPSLNPNTPPSLPELKKPEPIPQAFKPPQPQSIEPSPNYNDPNNQCKLDPCISGLQQKTQELQDEQRKLSEKINNLVVNNFNTNNITSSIIWVPANVPTVTCELNSETHLYVPTRGTTTIQVQTTATGSELTQIQAQFEEAAKTAESACHARNHIINWLEISVPTVTCELNSETNLYAPTRSTATIKIQSTSTGDETAKIQAEFEEAAKNAESACYARNQSSAVGIPETWAIQPGSGIPQLVITFRPKNLRTRTYQDSKWTICIPHPNYRALQLRKLMIEPQERGKYMAEATLKDNSKIRVHLLTEKKAIAYVENIVRTYVDRSMWSSKDPQDFIKTGVRPGIKLGTIYPYKVEYYSQGVKGAGSPDNQHYFER